MGEVQLNSGSSNEFWVMGSSELWELGYQNRASRKDKRLLAESGMFDKL